MLCCMLYAQLWIVVQVWLEHADWHLQGESTTPNTALQILKKARQVHSIMQQDKFQEHVNSAKPREVPIFWKSLGFVNISCMWALQLEKIVFSIRAESPIFTGKFHWFPWCC